MSESETNNQEPGPSAGTLIYVVDDEPMLLELASVILEPRGYTIETFRGAESALQAFENANPPPALVVTDYAMNAMTGMALVEACRQIRPGQKALLVSGTVGEEIFHHAPTKADGFLAKPFQARQLVEAVEAALAD